LKPWAIKNVVRIDGVKCGRKHTSLFFIFTSLFIISKKLERNDIQHLATPIPYSFMVENGNDLLPRLKPWSIKNVVRIEGVKCGRKSTSLFLIFTSLFVISEMLERNDIQHLATPIPFSFMAENGMIFSHG